MNTADSGLSHRFQVPGPVVSGLTGIKNALVKSLYFYLHLNTLRGGGVRWSTQLKFYRGEFGGNFWAAVRRSFVHIDLILRVLDLILRVLTLYCGYLTLYCEYLTLY